MNKSRQNPAVANDQASPFIRFFPRILNLQTAMSLVACAAVILGSPAIGLAGPIFGGNGDAFGDIIRNIAYYARNILIVLGFLGCCMAAFQKTFMAQAPWGKTLIGAGMCWGVATIAQLIFAFATNQSPTFDPTLSGN